MTERTRNGKTFAQDALGFCFCLVGGFFAVSIVLSLRGQEPKPGFVSALTSPVLELRTLLGPAAALLFSAGLAALGTVLFLRTTAFAALRPLLALLSGSLGVASIFGALGVKGELGGWLPGLVPGFVGSVLGIVLGVALAWLGWTLVAAERAPRTSTAALKPRVGLGPRLDASAGVSSAEAALLVSEPRNQVTRPAPRREQVTPLRDETIRPFTPGDVPGSAARAPRAEVSVKPARADVEPFLADPAPANASTFVTPEQDSPRDEPVSVLTPLAPSWEAAHDDEEDEDVEDLEEELEEEGEGSAQRLTEALSEEFETEAASASATVDTLEEEAEEGAADEEEEELGDGAAPLPPRASWEQTGLFDEEEELEEEAPAAKPAKVELTPTFDFEASEPKKPAHEPEPQEESVLVAKLPQPELDRAEDDEVGENDEEQDDPRARVAHRSSEPAAPVSSAPETQGFVLKPTPAPAPAPAPTPRSEPSVALDAEGEGWSKLVYDAGCAILEQKRVAVSMLERRFGIDFDQACRVLDELQQAGLIGPYMGGRTRDILLTREQWLPHAPHAS